jgi:hypothetical protein
MLPPASKRQEARMLRSARFGLALLLLTVAPATAQTPASPPQPEPIIVGPPPPPATALEAFRAAAGTIQFTAYEDLGEVAGVFVEARESRDSAGGRVRGIVVTMIQPRDNDRVAEPAYIDPEELPALMKAFDALEAITVNPNGEFRNFDMRYATRGELVLTASSTRQRGVIYGVEVGRMLKSRRSLNGGEFHQLRTLVEAAQQKLATLRNAR